MLDQVGDFPLQPFSLFFEVAQLFEVGTRSVLCPEHRYRHLETAQQHARTDVLYSRAHLQPLKLRVSMRRLQVAEPLRPLQSQHWPSIIVFCERPLR